MVDREIKRSKHQKPERRLYKECKNPECLSYGLSICRKEDFENCIHMRLIIAAQIMENEERKQE